MPFAKLIIVFVNIPRLILHLFFFFLFWDKCKEDVIINMVSKKYNSGIVLSFLYLLVFEKTYRNLFYWRIGWARYLIWYLLWSHPSFTIATDMKLGKGVRCIHPFSSIVNANSIGDFFTVRNNVTIGNNADGTDRPTIGHHVSINSNAVVIGDIYIGDNVIVGAGSVVTKNVPSNCVVVGNPAMIIRENGVPVRRKL